MTNQTRSDVHDAATKAETLAYNLANASSLASVLSEVLDKEIGGTIEGQSLAALITLLDKLAEDCEELSGDLYGLRNRLLLGERCGMTGTWPSSK